MARMKKTKITILCPACMKNFVEFEVRIYNWSGSSATIINPRIEGKSYETKCACGAIIKNRDSSINLDIKKP